MATTLSLLITLLQLLLFDYFYVCCTCSSSWCCF